MFQKKESKKNLVGHTSYIRGILLISNEKIASCDQDGKIIIWNIENCDCLKKIEAHSDAIWSLGNLSNNKIISCSRDKTIKVWDINECICLTLNGHVDEVFCLDSSN